MTRSANSGSVRQLLIRDRILVRVQEHPAVPGADEVQELSERELGLPPPAAASRVGEEGVLEPQADFPLAPLSSTRPSGTRSRCPVNVGRLFGAGRPPGRAAARPARRS